MRIYKIGIFSSLLALALLQGCQQNTENQEEKEVLPPLVSVSKSILTDSAINVNYSGSIVPDNTTEISFALTGTINKVAVTEGQKVHKGQFLASLDATEYEAALQIANANLEQSQDAYRRFDELYKKGSFPEKDYIDIKTKVAQALANKIINKNRVNDSRLLAPINGIITRKAAEVGGFAAPGEPAFTIVKTDMVYVQFTVPESEIGNFKQGMQVDVNIPTLQRNFSGKISIINPLADEISKTFTLKVRLNNPDGILLPGMIAEVTAEISSPVKRVTVPLTSIVNDLENVPYVFVVDTDNIARMKRVNLGGLAGNFVVIRSGLDGTETIVINGQNNLTDGQTVRIDNI